MCLPPFISLTSPPLRLMCPVITSPLAIISSLLPLIWSNTLLPLGNCPGFPRRKHFLKKFYFFSLESSWVRGRVCAGLRGFARVCTGLRARACMCPRGGAGQSEREGSRFPAPRDPATLRPRLEPKSRAHRSTHRDHPLPKATSPAKRIFYEVCVWFPHFSSSLTNFWEHLIF